MDKPKKDLQSLLREAATLPGTGPVPAITSRDEGVAKALEVIQQDKWKDIEDALQGEFAERFLDEMRALSGREFVRVYTKMLEYVKPKIVRVENKVVEEEDRLLRIEVYNSPQLQTPPPNLIDVTPKDEE